MYRRELSLLIGTTSKALRVTDLAAYVTDAECPLVGVRRAKAAFLSGCESHPAILLQPEAIGAAMEVTK